MAKPRYRAHHDGTFELVEGPPPTIDVDTLQPYAYAGQSHLASYEYSVWDGAKYPGGFGPTQVYWQDYWTMRSRSTQLFTENMYARGIIRRLITNEVNTGLMPEATPIESLLGMEEDSLADWTEDVENRFAVYGSQPKVCDWYEQMTFGQLQRVARAEALIAGDALCVLRYPTDLRKPPKLQLINGAAVMTPWSSQTNIAANHTIEHGVELDAQRRHVAYWIRQADGSFKRLAAYGPRSGRRIAWLMYGTDKRLDEVRGQPLLAIVMQSLKEIDRYRDSVQRKALVNSFIATYIKKTEDKMGTLPFSGGATRKSEVTTVDNNNTQRKFNAAAQIPGMVFEELQTGEEPVAFSNSVGNEKFAEFEAAVIHAVAWSNQIPPEILQQAFSNNYSASQAAINEFRIYLNLVWQKFGEDFCDPIYQAWLINQVQQRRIDAPGMLDAWRNPLRYDEFGAWIATQWYGSIKPSTDMSKQVRASVEMIRNGFSTYAREARILAGTKFTQNIKRLTREVQLLVSAMQPLNDAEQAGNSNAGTTAQSQLSDLQATTGDMLELLGGS